MSEYGRSCELCGDDGEDFWDTWWTTDAAAKAAVHWHMYTHHRQDTGGLEPGPLPETLGAKVAG